MKGIESALAWLIKLLKVILKWGLVITKYGTKIYKISTQVFFPQNITFNLYVSKLVNSIFLNH